MIGRKVRDFLPEEDLLAYSEAILRVYNRYGRRDNKYKARIKILVHETGLEELKADIEGNSKRSASVFCACRMRKCAGSRPISHRRRSRSGPTSF
jgi:sulfite reductase beta subunit-like hemoprotein